MASWMAAVAVLLGAVQLLPGLEAAREASRTTGVAVSWDMLAGGLRTLTGFVGPALSTDPNWLWEDRAGFGLVWLAAAVLAPLLRPTPGLRFQVAVCAVWLFLALGGYFLLQGLPGFKLFQLPSRMLLLAAFPVALFAGVTTQALFAGRPLLLALRKRGGGVVLRLGVATALVAVTLGVALHLRGETLRFPAYWITLVLLLPLSWWLLVRGPLHRRWVFGLWLGILLVDVWASPGRSWRCARRARFSRPRPRRAT